VHANKIYLAHVLNTQDKRIALKTLCDSGKHLGDKRDLG